MDSENVDSNNALFYYIDRADKTKLNVSYDGIANDNYVAIAKRYVETVGRVDELPTTADATLPVSE